MSGKRECITPISEANTRRIRTHIELPFGLSDQVGINTQRIESLLQIAGFIGARIIGDFGGDTSTSVPQVVGMDSRGSALAGRAEMKTVPTQTQETIDPGGGIRKQGRWKGLNLTLNLAEMQNQIRQSDDSVRNPAAWATRLDKALKQGLVSAGVRNLLGDMNGFDKFVSLFVYGSDLAAASDAGIGNVIVGNVNPHIPIVEEAVANFLWSGMVWLVWDSIFMGFEREGKGRRLSLFVGPEVDRAIVLGVVGSLNQLADVVEN